MASRGGHYGIDWPEVIAEADCACARMCVCACGACALACMCKQMRPPLFFLSLTFPNTVYNNEDRVPREIQFAAPTGELEKSFLSHRRGVKKMFFLYTEQKPKKSVLVL